MQATAGIPFLYRSVRALVHVLLGVYFKKLEYIGRRHIPEVGPILVVANHPQAAIDAMVLYLSTGRMVHFLAKSGLFKKRTQAAFLRKIGVMPVHRPHETTDASSKNVEMFAACYDLMERGGVLALFPEGVSIDEPRLQPLKTGAARIALESESQNDWQLGIRIVPAGLSFESTRRFRSRVLAGFCEPLIAADYRERYEKDPVEAVRDLTRDIEEAIRGRIVHIEKPEFETLVRDVESVYKNELLDLTSSSLQDETNLARTQRIQREIPRAIEHFHKENPIDVQRLGGQIRDYRQLLQQVRVTDDMLAKGDGRSVTGASLRFFILGLLGLPFAAYGVIFNILPYKFTTWMTHRTVKPPTPVHGFLLGIGAVAFIAFYVLLYYLTRSAFGPARTPAFIATLPIMGFYALGYIRRMTARRATLRVANLELRRGYLMRRLRQHRSDLMAELDKKREAFLDLKLDNEL